MLDPARPIRLLLCCASLFGCAAGDAIPTPTPSATPSASPTPTAPPQTERFEDVSAASGLDLVPTCGDDTKDYILEVNGSGACWLDYDGDGVLDVYLVDGSTMQRWAAGEPGEPNRLYRGHGDGTFTEVPGAAGLDDRGWGFGCAIADIDDDGDADVLVTNYGANRLYRNRGDGRFEDVTEVAGVASPSSTMGNPMWSTGASFFDADNDGHLDLFVVNYLEFDVADPPLDGHEVGGSTLSCKYGGQVVMCGPLGLIPQGDRLYRNRGDGRFEDVTETSGIAAARPGYGFSAVPFDFDGDGDVDLYVANDSVPNHLWQNDGSGHFSEVALATGTAVDETGRAQASMGLDVGDVDGDGLPDIVFSNFASEYYALLRNLGDGMFIDVSYTAGLASPTIDRLGWGLGLIDQDNDGDLDLFIANGHVYPGLGSGEGAFRQRNQLFLYDDGRFTDVSDEAGPALQARRVGRSAAFADFDRDGGVDVLITNLGERPTLLRNTGPRGHWLEVRLVGSRSNRDGLGARLTLQTADGRRQVRDRRTGSSYVAAHAPLVHFGLGEARTARLEVAWPSGARTAVAELAADQIVTIDEDRGLRADPGGETR